MKTSARIIIVASTGLLGCSGGDAGPDARVLSERECPGLDLQLRPDAQGRLPALQISEFLPEVFIELYNASDAPIDLAVDTGYAIRVPIYSGPEVDPWSERSYSLPLPDAGIIQPKSYLLLGSHYFEISGSGELILYRDSWDEGALDYLCWGYIPDFAIHGSPGHWTGPCIFGPVSPGSVVRRADSPGEKAQDYEVEPTPSPLDCLQ